MANEQRVHPRKRRKVCAFCVDKVTAIDYPKDKLEIQILDDSTDDTYDLCLQQVEYYRQQGFDIKCLHRTDRTGFKAGALEAADAVAKGEYLLILDADFRPEPDILKVTIPYFMDPKVALVQTRWGHINRNHNLLTRLQSVFLDGHFALEQTCRNRSGRFFTFNGTAGVWRKSAIYDAGGWDRVLSFSHSAKAPLSISVMLIGRYASVREDARINAYFPIFSSPSHILTDVMAVFWKNAYSLMDFT